jgi:hypothetical protein
MTTTQDTKAELKATIAEINALIEAELNKLMPILGEETTATLAMELDIDPARLKLVYAPSARPHMRRE